ncbi:MAG: hypothetical protein ACO1Q7_03035 [Gemmatimonas sp.]
MNLLLFVVANACSVLATLMAITFCMAGGANASPEAIRNLKAAMIGFAIVGVLGLLGSILLRRTGYEHATLVAFAPTLIVIVMFIVAYVREW